VDDGERGRKEGKGIDRGIKRERERSIPGIDGEKAKRKESERRKRRRRRRKRRMRRWGRRWETQRLVVSLSATTLNRPSALPRPSDPAARFYSPHGNPRTEDKNQYERVAISL